MTCEFEVNDDKSFMIEIPIISHLCVKPSDLENFHRNPEYTIDLIFDFLDPRLLE